MLMLHLAFKSSILFLYSLFSQDGPIEIQDLFFQGVLVKEFHILNIQHIKYINKYINTNCF